MKPDKNVYKKRLHLILFWFLYKKKKKKKKITCRIAFNMFENRILRKKKKKNIK